jgi:cytochrome c553
VIDAVAKDLPYDQFIRQQIAGDLLPADSEAQRDAQNIATGFLAIGVQDVNQRFKVRFEMDNVDEQIDTVSRSVLALTASCARCHDHKFDPIPVTDYYGLAGIFRSTDLCNGLKNKMGGGGLDYWVPENMLHLTSGVKKMDAEHLAKLEAARKEAAKAKADFDAIKGTPKGKAIAENGKPYQFPFRIKAEKAAAVVASLEGNTSMVMGVREGKAPADTEIRVRGEAEALGPTVPRGFLTAFEVPGAAPVNPKQSGRLELADWLTSDKNPLASRVMANRVWKHLFGQGIVSSVDNFGTTGAAPSDPDLLDHLANRFIRDGWSVKKLIRTLVLTHAYRLSSDSNADNLAADPGNRLVWRHSPRRLDAEEIRDAMLVVAGQLDRNHRSGSEIRDLQVIELKNNGPEAGKIIDAADTSRARSIYLPLLRGLTPRSMEVFDFAEQGMVTGSRDTTTVATQALYLLNDGFVHKQALTLAKDVLHVADAGDADRIRVIYQRSLGRQPTAGEVQRAATFLAEYESALREAEMGDARGAAWASFCQAVLASAEFRYLR